MTLFLPAKRAAAPPETPAGLRIGFWACIAVGIGIVARRMFALQHISGSSGSPPELARLDAWFQTHASLTYAHILSALVFLCVLPLVFWSRTQRLAVVRGAYYCLGGAVAVTAYAISVYSVGGWIERSAVLVFNTLFAIELVISCRAWRAAMPTKEKRWMLRSTATVLGIATTRPVMAVFFVTSSLTHWTVPQFFGPAFWIGFSINVIFTEIWLRQNATQTEAISYEYVR